MEELWEKADAEEPRFRVVWRGYDRSQVDGFLRVAANSTADEHADEDADAGLRPEFAVVLRGYDRKEVERYFDRFLR